MGQVFAGLLLRIRMGANLLLGGGEYVVMWNCSSDDVVFVDYSYTSGVVWENIAGNVSCVAGINSVVWQVPEVSSEQCLIRVRTSSGESDQSDGEFTIYPCFQQMDFDGDCEVGLSDFVLFAGQWLSCGNPYDFDCGGNVRPDITSTATVQTFSSIEYSYTVTADDTAGDVITFELVIAPGCMAINAVTGKISWTPDVGEVGQHTVIVSATDEAGAADIQIFEIEVNSISYSGAPVEGMPSLKERQTQVFINAVRMAPEEYRDSYMADFNPAPGGILLNENYPAVEPVYYSRELNESARFHSEDMATNCGLQHDSCDGTNWADRIYSFYSSSCGISENVAFGFSGARDTVNQFLCDRVGGSCAADLTSAAGHRTNIMRSSSKVFGVGFAEPYWWTQDFGTCVSSNNSVIVSACHDFLVPGSTSFLLNYRDTSNADPVELKVVVDGVEHDMELDMGTSSAGTYRVDLDESGICRSYYFYAKTPSGQIWRYPGPGVFMTVGEGTCTEDYVTQ